MAALQPVRGTKDLYGDDMRRYRHVVDTARLVAQRYGMQEIAPPIFEFTPVFARTMGEGSDVVRKEMYSFTDRSGEDITLRPEFTAGICRAVISEGMRQHLPVKFFAAGPAFRYERPQKGRYRQFHQIDAEIIGVAGPQADIEIIALGADILAALNILEPCTLEINSLGDVESRQAYRAALVGYLTQHKSKLSEDSVDRLQRSPLRILDSKDPGDQEIVAEAPLFEEFLNNTSKDFFAEVLAGLQALQIPYRHNQRLVRGLDYYTHTAFEFVTDALGAQGAVIAGGRYDGLIETLGGPATPGIGWAGGVERMMLLCGTIQQATRPIALIPIGGVDAAAMMALAHHLRGQGFDIEHGYSGNMSKRLKRANKHSARAAILIGEDEQAAGTATVRDLDSGEQQSVAIAQLEGHLQPFCDSG